MIVKHAAVVVKDVAVVVKCVAVFVYYISLVDTLSCSGGGYCRKHL